LKVGTGFWLVPNYCGQSAGKPRHGSHMRESQRKSKLSLAPRTPMGPIRRFLKILTHPLVFHRTISVPQPQFMAVDPQPGYRAQGFGARQRFRAEGVVDEPFAQQNVGKVDLAEFVSPPQPLERRHL
jgi:hypothetical protein